jgi:hypothetical protein
MGLYSQVLALLKALLCKLVNNLRAKYIQVFQSVACFYNQPAQIKLSISRLVANLIIQAQLIKAGLIHVLHRVGDLGQQLLTIAHQILQRVKALFQRGH